MNKPLRSPLLRSNDGRNVTTSPRPMTAFRPVIHTPSLRTSLSCTGSKCGMSRRNVLTSPSTKTPTPPPAPAPTTAPEPATTPAPADAATTAAAPAQQKALRLAVYPLKAEGVDEKVAALATDGVATEIRKLQHVSVVAMDE